MSVAIRRAGVTEAARLGRFGAELFRDAYGPTHPEPALSRYLAESFAPDDVARRLADPARVFLVAETDEGEWCGYVELRAGSPDDARVCLARPLPGARALEIVRFYVSPSYQGRGVAQALMQASQGIGAEGGHDVLWLQAWQEAAQALRFYRKMGFEPFGTAVFPFGDREDQDVLLARPAVIEHQVPSKAAGPC